MFENEKKALKDERNVGFLILIIGVPIVALLYIVVPALVR
jgi:hypothetical protein